MTGMVLECGGKKGVFFKLVLTGYKSYLVCGEGGGGGHGRVKLVLRYYEPVWKGKLKVHHYTS